MKIDTVVNCDSIEIFIKGEKVSLLRDESLSLGHNERVRDKYNGPSKGSFR